MELNQHPSDDIAQIFWQVLHQQMNQRPRLAPWLARHGRILLERFTHWYQTLHWLPRWTRRRWQRKLGISLAGMALALALKGVPTVQAAPPLQADAIIVTTNDPTINDGDELCSLIEAIVNANDDAATYSDCAAGSGDDVITLAGVLYTLTSAYSPKNGLPSITSNIVIEGNGAIITSEPDKAYRILDVTSTGDLTLNHTTISGGAEIGGGIHNNGGQLTLNYTTVTSSGVMFENGGGIYNSGTATLNSSTVRDNLGWYGGGIYNNNGTLLLRDSTVSGNSSIVGWGGGIFNYLGTVTLENSTVSGNRVETGYNGGGIYNRDGTLTLINTTITNNRADRGGGLYNAERTGASVITLINSIVANNTGGDCAITGGQINALYSLIQNGLGCVNGVNTGNRIGDPLLGPLRDNGGPTFTHALLDNSPAINGGHNDHIPDGVAYDQRGSDFPRIRGGTVDMGAVESTATDAPIFVTTNNPVIDTTDARCSLPEAIINANDDAATYSDCAAGNGHDLIRLQAGDYTIPAAYAAGNGLPIITSSMEIEGNGATIRRNPGSGHYRILKVASTGDLTLSYATITGGDGYGSYTGGGGIYNAGVLTITNSTIMDNHHEGGQGGGGGLYNAGKMTLLNSTVSGNRADLWHGGGIHNIGELSVINSTISANDAPGYDGGGIANNGVLTLTNSIIANNGGDSECWSAWWDRSLIHASHSLIEDNLGCVNGTNISNWTGDPNLGPLQDNGGPTFTHALLVGSLAINRGAAAACADPFMANNLDQRGIARPQGAYCDIGAFELVDTLAPTANPTVDPAANANGWHNSEFIVTWNWVEASDGSGIDAANCVTSSTSSGEGEYLVSATCADLVGNQGSANYAAKLDLTKPTISAIATSGPNAAGWYNSPMAVQFICVDALSGIPDGGCPAAQVLTDEGTAVTSTVATVNDNAGNSSEPSNVVTVQIDRTPPVVMVTGVSEGAVYSQQSVPLAGCNTQDDLSGVAITATLRISGGNPDGTGSFTASCEDARDNADNVGSAVVNYTVDLAATLFGVCGDYQVYQTDDGYFAHHFDTLAPWEGNILVGTELQDNLTGDAGNDLILGLGGNDILNGKAGDDIICGGEGNDLIYGELGNDYLDGGNHNDVLNGGTGDFDVLLGGEGNDTLLDPDGVADLQGGPGHDQINFSLRNGWRTTDGQTEFLLRFAAGLGNDTITFGILGTDSFIVDITGDEWTDQAGEGTADTIRFAGRIDPDTSQFRKFEGQVIISASELPLLTDETGYEYWVDESVEESPNEEEPVEEELPSQEEPNEEAPGEEELPAEEEPSEEEPGEEELPNEGEPSEEVPSEEELPDQEAPGEEDPTPQPPITDLLEHQLYLPLVRR